MRRPGRRLTAEETEIWAQVARTVKPLEKRRPASAVAIAEATRTVAEAPPPPLPVRKVKGRVPPPLAPRPVPPKPKAETQAHLDGSWDKRITKGTLMPDFSLDLHGATLDQAYTRLMHGLTQARAMGARVVLIVTGKSRPVDAADRGTARGAIRAKVSDWLSASDHASDIVAIRGAHRRHGGQGAIYVVLKKRR
ncbi:Smr/MutS family protein [Novosphingobium sp. P6W]|uniref:Smr/MutS family protein n=1 Tax=Novosphingobium sp. P6W TaxID=1609758 RepID=UPI0005C2BA0A|nr:Smr/MutS family protein [Novosphingobium sp. P6W]AXB75621.1 DNA mismatch repair protein MutS [Novosphingobium sp. P6W]KIS29695.1 DNA mismatch repair protein MutS [Novosphingobium sp. P6W]